MFYNIKKNHLHLICNIQPKLHGFIPLTFRTFPETVPYNLLICLMQILKISPVSFLRLDFDFKFLTAFGASGNKPVFIVCEQR